MKGGKKKKKGERKREKRKDTRERDRERERETEREREKEGGRDKEQTHTRTHTNKAKDRYMKCCVLCVNDPPATQRQVVDGHSEFRLGHVRSKKLQLHLVAALALRGGKKKR